MNTDHDDLKRLAGAWRLIDFAGDDYAMRTRGAHSTGLVIYDPTGVMSLQIMPDMSIRSAFAAKEPTPDEAKSAFTGYQAYFGTYSVDPEKRLSPIISKAISIRVRSTPERALRVSGTGQTRSAHQLAHADMAARANH